MIIHHNIEQRLAEECKMCVRIFAEIGGGVIIEQMCLYVWGGLVGLQVASILKLIPIWQKIGYLCKLLLVQRNSETLWKPWCWKKLNLETLRD